MPKSRSSHPAPSDQQAVKATPSRNCPRILAISSSVAVGHVGLSAIAPTLYHLAITPALIPTITLSNHPAFPHAAAFMTPPADILAMRGAISANGWLASFDTVLTGYLPTAAHVAAVVETIHELRTANPAVRFICDPVLGDDPKGLYLDPAAAGAIARDLVPLADIVLPNRFELEFLAGDAVTTPQSAIAAATKLIHQPKGARSNALRRIIAKSIPLGRSATDATTLCNIEISNADSRQMTVKRHPGVPNGTGDMFSALIAAGWMMERATSAMSIITEAAAGLEHLPIVETAADWSTVPDTNPDADDAATVAGADGCPAGWLTVSFPVGRPAEAHWTIYPTFADLLELPAKAIAVDMPIGLPNIAEAGGRAADRAARAVLGARRNSVFSVPARATIACADYGDACATALHHSIPPRKIAKQTFHLFSKIREVDQLMTPALQGKVAECHPEVSFWALNGKTALSEPKKVKSAPYAPGLDLRRGLLANAGFNEQFLRSFNGPRQSATEDDFLDACAVAWTADRLAAGRAERLPTVTPIPTDSRGLRMEIVY